MPIGNGSEDARSRPPLPSIDRAEVPDETAFLHICGICSFCGLAAAGFLARFPDFFHVSSEMNNRAL